MDGPSSPSSFCGAVSFSGGPASFLSNSTSVASDIGQELHQELMQWLGVDHLGSSLRRKILKKTEVIILKVDVMELFGSFPCLGEKVLSSPESLSQDIMRSIVSGMQNQSVQDVLLQTRIHIRWQGAVPLPVCQSVRDVVRCVREQGASGPTPIQFRGVVHTVSSLHKRTHLRRVRCRTCAMEHLVFEALSDEPPSCCGGGFEEDISSRVEVTCQVSTGDCTPYHILSFKSWGRSIQMSKWHHSGA